MDFRAYKPQLIIAAHVAVLFAVAAVGYGVNVAAILVTSAVLGYLNSFAAFRSLLAVVRKRPVSRLTASLVAVSAAGSVSLGWFGYWQPLAIFTLSLVFIDAVVLRFVGRPVGTAAGAP